MNCTTGVPVPVNALTDGSGRFIAVAVLHAGDDFVVDPADEFLTQREIVIDASYFPSGGGQIDNQRVVQYRRPVVLLVHGMWGAATDYWFYALLGDTRYTAHLADYETLNDAFFSEIYPHVPVFVQEALELYRSQDIESEGVDLISHSLGGLVSKGHAAGHRTNYVRPDNYNTGDYHKWVGIASPLGGSELAPFYKSIVATPLRKLFEATGRTDNGIMYSLDPSGPDIMDFPSATVQAGSLVRAWGGSELRDLGMIAIADTWIRKIPNGLRAFDYVVEDIMLNCDTGDDFIVCEWSQGGGLSPQFITEMHVDSGRDCLSYHTVVTAEICTNDVVDELLNALVSDPRFTTYLPSGAEILATQPQSPAPPPATPPESQADRSQKSVTESGGEFPTALSGDGFTLTMEKQGDSAILNFTAGATRLFRGMIPLLTAGCIALTGGTTFSDVGILSSGPNFYYRVDNGSSTGCMSPGNGIAVTGVSPKNGPVTGNKKITLIGNDFIRGSTTVSIDGASCSQVKVVNANTLECRTPKHLAGGPYDIVVSNGGSPVILTNAFTFADYTGGIVISNPLDQSIVQAGSAIEVTLTGYSGFQLSRGTVFGPNFVKSQGVVAGQVTTSVAIPSAMNGSLRIEAYGWDSYGNLVEANPITVYVGLPPGVDITGISVSPQTLFLSSARMDRPYTIWAMGSDGINRNITLDPEVSCGTENASIATARPGLLTGVASGHTNLLVSYLGYTIEVPVSVGYAPIVLTMQGQNLQWTSQGTGEFNYDVVKGDLTLLRGTDGDFTVATTSCLASDTPALSTSDSGSPGPSEAYFYLVRSWTYDTNDLTAGGWPSSKQQGNRSSEINQSPASCRG